MWAANGSYILAALAAALYILSFLSKDEVKLRLCNMTSASLWALYYLTLDASSGAAMFGIGALRHAVSLTTLSRGHRFKQALACVFMVAQTIGLYASWHSPLSLLPFISAVSATYAYVVLSGFPLRLTLILGNPLWLIYDALTGTYAHLLIEMASTCTGLYGLHRLWRADVAGTHS